MDELMCQITPYEIRVLKLIVEGKTNKEIAEALNTSLRATIWHVNRIFEKTSIHNRKLLITKYYLHFQ